MSRGPVALLVLLLLVGGATASPTKASQSPWTLLIPEEVGFDANGTGAHMVPLGDVDGDGFADLLAVNDETGSGFALAGPELERVIWSESLPGGWAVPILDVDGDGVGDLWGYGGGMGTASGQGVSEAGVSASVYEMEYTWPEQVTSGATGMQLAQLRDGSSTDSATARVSQGAPGVYVSTYAMLASSQSVYDFIVGQDQLWSIEVESYQAYGYSYNSLPVPMGYQSQAVEPMVSLTRSDLGGQPKFSIEFDEPARVLLFAGFADLDGDDVADLVAVTAPRPVNVDGEDVSYGSEAWIAYSGDDGQVMWQQEGDAALRQVWFREMYIGAVGDVDGDGSQDIMAAEFTYGGSSFDAGARILSGADGSTMVSSTGDTWYMPFGDVDGDGAAEFLIVSAGSQDGYSLSVANLDETLWTTTVGAYSEPLNVAVEGEHYLFTDVTGDAFPDILLWDWTDDPWDEEDAEAVFSLIDGSTGHEVWQSNVGAILGATATDMTGDGLVDLVLVAGIEADGSRSGYFSGTNHTLSVMAHRGTDGKSVWSRVVMDPVLAGDRNMTQVDGWPAAAGDIDGDGHGDLLIFMWRECGWEFIWTDDGDVIIQEAVDCETFRQWLVMSGKDASLMHMMPELAIKGSDPLPPVERGEAFTEVADDKDGPVPLALLLAALMGVALRRRR